MNICCENTVTVSYDAFMTICFVFVCVVFFVCVVVDASTISALVCPSFLHSSVLPKEGTAFAYSLSSALTQQLDSWFLTKRLRLNRVDKGSMTDCSRKGSSARLDTVRLAKKTKTRRRRQLRRPLTSAQEVLTEREIGFEWQRFHRLNVAFEQVRRTEVDTR